VAESPFSAVPALPGLTVETVEWLPSGAESGLVRVRGRWTDEAARHTELPVLALRADGGEHRFDSLPDARFSRDPASWRGTYLVPAALIGGEPALWLEWADGARSGLSALARGIEPPPVQGTPVAEPEERGGEVIDRAVLAERRARRAEAAERHQARVAAEALKAVEVLELRSAELERRLEEAVAEREALVARETEADERRGALAAALASAAELRSRSREWQLRMRTNEVTRAGDAVRLAVLEAERATTAPSLRAALDEAKDAAVAARSALSETDARFTGAREAWDQRRVALESELGEVRAALEEARIFESRLQVETVARTTLEDELDRERAARADLRRQLEETRAERDTALTDAVAARAEAATLSDLRAEAADVPGLRADLEAERAARRAAEEKLVEIEALHARIAELEQRAQSGREELERLAQEQAAAAAAREPAADPTRLVADLDAAAEALRQRVAPDADPEVEIESFPPAPPPVEPATAPAAAPAERTQPSLWAGRVPPAEPAAPDAEPTLEWSEPAAPDAEPAVEWSEVVESELGAVAPGVEPRREGETAPEAEWSPPAFGHVPVAVEPPAPDAEPYVEWSPPEPAAEPPAPEPEPVAAPAGPRIVPASKPPARGLMIGTDRRDYPLLRGAIVKLAHDNPDLAGRLLAALLPAQGAAMEGPLGYDITIKGTGTYGVAIAGGRAGVEEIDVPRGRHVADFHLTADALILAELLAGVNHRIGRFFGPVRVKGRKRSVRALKALQSTSASLTDAARAGAALDPELVYRTFAYAVHPSWTRGHAFTIAQTIDGDPPETWYLTAADGTGLTVSSTPPQASPAATVAMSREVFGKLLRGETVANGQRPSVHGDAGAVALMHEWTQRARANA
jgi:hypothetical protein